MSISCGEPIHTDLSVNPDPTLGLKDKNWNVHLNDGLGAKTELITLTEIKCSFKPCVNK